MIFYFILIATICAFSVSIYNRWLAAKGYMRQYYWMVIVESIVFFTLNSVVALKNPNNYGLIIFNGLSVWSVLMSIKGLKRLGKARP